MKLFLLSLSLIGFLQKSYSQTLVFAENFNDTAALGQLPNGWLGTPGGYFVENSNPSDTTFYPEASGGQNLVIRNNISVTGTYTVQTPPFSISGYDMLQVSYGVRNTTNFPLAGSAIASFDFSVDNGNTWNGITYINTPANSTWAPINEADPINIPLPIGSSTCMLRWTANIVNNPNGTYRIDDIVVLASTGASTSTRKTTDSGILQFNTLVSDGYLQIVTKSVINSIRLYDMSGKTAKIMNLPQGNHYLDVQQLPKGMYFLEEPGVGCLGKIIIQ